MGMKITQRSFSNQSKFDLSNEPKKNSTADYFYIKKVKLQIENPSPKNIFQAKIKNQNHACISPWETMVTAPPLG